MCSLGGITMFVIGLSLVVSGVCIAAFILNNFMHVQIQPIGNYFHRVCASISDDDMNTTSITSIEIDESQCIEDRKRLLAEFFNNVFVDFKLVGFERIKKDGNCILNALLQSAKRNGVELEDLSNTKQFRALLNDYIQNNWRKDPQLLFYILFDINELLSEHQQFYKNEAYQRLYECNEHIIERLRGYMISVEDRSCVFDSTENIDLEISRASEQMMEAYIQYTHKDHVFLSTSAIYAFAKKYNVAVVIIDSIVAVNSMKKGIREMWDQICMSDDFCIESFFKDINQGTIIINSDALINQGALLSLYRENNPPYDHYDIALLST